MSSYSCTNAGTVRPELQGFREYGRLPRILASDQSDQITAALEQANWQKYLKGDLIQTIEKVFRHFIFVKTAEIFSLIGQYKEAVEHFRFLFPTMGTTWAITSLTGG